MSHVADRLTELGHRAISEEWAEDYPYIAATIGEAADRVDALEMALREIASRQYGVPENTWKSEINALSKIARRALKENNHNG